MRLSDRAGVGSLFPKMALYFPFRPVRGLVPIRPLLLVFMAFVATPQTAKHVVCNLVPGVATVQLNGAVIAIIAVNAAGCIYFTDTTGGGQFQIDVTPAVGPAPVSDLSVRVVVSQTVSKR